MAHVSIYYDLLWAPAHFTSAIKEATENPISFPISTISHIESQTEGLENKNKMQQNKIDSHWEKPQQD